MPGVEKVGVTGEGGGGEESTLNVGVLGWTSM